MISDETATTKQYYSISLCIAYRSVWVGACVFLARIQFDFDEWIFFSNQFDAEREKEEEVNDEWNKICACLTPF